MSLHVELYFWQFICKVLYACILLTNCNGQLVISLLWFSCLKLLVFLCFLVLNHWSVSSLFQWSKLVIVLHIHLTLAQS